MGATPEILQSAEKVIIEVNTRLPSFEGLHDLSGMRNPPYRLAYPVRRVDDRIGLVPSHSLFCFALSIYSLAY